MPQAPEKYSPPTSSGDGITRHNAGAPGGQRGGGGLYQSYGYIQFRQRVKELQRAKDEEVVHTLYLQLHQRSFQDYMRWLAGDNPLCVECLDEEMIKPGRVMDHKKPIDRGGPVWDRDNLQWLCDYHHNQKRATEDQQ